MFIELGRYENRKHLDLMVDILGCDASDVEDEFAANFPSQWFSYTPYSNVDVHAFSTILAKVRKRIDEVNLNHCNLDADKLETICSAIQKMEGSVSCLASIA